MSWTKLEMFTPFGDNVVSKKEKRLLLVGPPGATHICYFLLFAVICALVSVIYHISLREALADFNLFFIIVSVINLAAMICCLAITFSRNFKKIECIVITNCNKRFRAKYKWDNIIDNKSFTDPARMADFLIELADWLHEQEFTGKVELVITNKYPLYVLLAEDVYFRFTLEEDLILVKTVWG